MEEATSRKSCFLILAATVLVLLPAVRCAEGSRYKTFSRDSSNRRVLNIGTGDELPNSVNGDKGDEDDVKTPKDPNSAGDYANIEMLNSVMKQADLADFKFPVRRPPLQTSTTEKSQDSSMDYDINPFHVLPPGFHHLLNIPLHVFKNGTTFNPNEKYSKRPLISGGYASTNMQGSIYKRPGSNTPRVSYQPTYQSNKPTSNSSKHSEVTRKVQSFESTKIPVLKKKRPSFSRATVPPVTSKENKQELTTFKNKVEVTSKSTMLPTEPPYTPTTQSTTETSSIQTTKTPNTRRQRPKYSLYANDRLTPKRSNLKPKNENQENEEANQTKTTESDETKVPKIIESVEKEIPKITESNEKKLTKVSESEEPSIRNEPDRIPSLKRKKTQRIRYTKRPTTTTAKPKIIQMVKIPIENVVGDSEDKTSQNVEPPDEKMFSKPDQPISPAHITEKPKPNEKPDYSYNTNKATYENKEIIPSSTKEDPVNNKRFVPSEYFTMSDIANTNKNSMTSNTFGSRPSFSSSNVASNTFVRRPTTTSSRVTSNTSLRRPSTATPNVVPNTFVKRPSTTSPKLGSNTFHRRPSTTSPRVVSNTSIRKPSTVNPSVESSSFVRRPNTVRPAVKHEDFKAEVLPPVVNTNYVPTLQSRDDNITPNNRFYESENVLNENNNNQVRQPSHWSSNNVNTNLLTIDNNNWSPSTSRQDANFILSSSGPSFASTSTKQNRPAKKKDTSQQYLPPVYDLGFTLPDEAGNLPPRNSLFKLEDRNNPARRNILPQFRPNVRNFEDEFRFNPSQTKQNAPQIRRRPPPYNPSFSYRPPPPPRSNRRNTQVRKRPSFLDSFNFFGRQPVDRRRGESGQLMHSNRIKDENKTPTKMDEKSSEYLRAHGPVPIEHQKVVVFGPFNRPPPGAPIIVPQNGPGAPILVPQNGPGAPILVPQNGQGAPILVPQNGPGAPILVPQNGQGAPIFVPQNGPGAPILVPQNGLGAPNIVPQNGPSAPIIVPQNGLGAPIIVPQNSSYGEASNLAGQQILPPHPRPMPYMPAPLSHPTRYINHETQTANEHFMSMKHTISKPPFFAERKIKTFSPKIPNTLNERANEIANGEIFNNQIYQTPTTTANKNIKNAHTVQLPKSILQTSVLTSPEVIYGKPASETRQTVNGNAFIVEVGNRFNTTNSEGTTQNSVYQYPNLIDNVTDEDKEAIIAAKFYIPRLNNVHRSGQNRIIPLPVPILSNDITNKSPFVLQHFPINRNFIAANNQPVVNAPSKSPVLLSHVMLPPPPQSFSYFHHQNELKSEPLIKNTVPHSDSQTVHTNTLIVPKATEKHDVSQTLKDKELAEEIPENNYNSLSTSSKMNNNSNYNNNGGSEDVSNRRSVDVNEGATPPVPSNIIQTAKPFKKYNTFRYTTLSPNKPMRITSFNPKPNHVPETTESPPQSFVEPNIPDHSYGGWVVVGASVPNSVNPVVEYVQENTPEIIIKEPESKILTLEDFQRTVKSGFSEVGEKPIMPGSSEVGDVITGSSKEDVQSPELVKYSTKLSIDAPDVVKSYVMPKN